MFCGRDLNASPSKQQHQHHQQQQQRSLDYNGNGSGAGIKQGKQGDTVRVFAYYHNARSDTMREWERSAVARWVNGITGLERAT